MFRSDLDANIALVIADIKKLRDCRNVTGQTDTLAAVRLPANQLADNEVKSPVWSGQDVGL